MKKKNLHKSSTKQSQKRDKRKEPPKSNWVEEIRESFNRNRNRNIAVT